MSAYSDAWRDMDPRTRDFYRNWADIHTSQRWHAVYWSAYDIWLPFTMLGESLDGYLGIHIAQRNWGIQRELNDSFDPSTVLMATPDLPTDAPTEPKYQIDDFGYYYGDPSVITDYAIEYPRAAYKVRKSYWTGAPRRRRNR